MHIRSALVPFAILLAGALVGCTSTVDGNAIAAPGATSQPPTTTPPPTAPSPDSTVPDLEPTRPGWTVLVNQNAHLAYDIPPDWDETPGGVTSDNYEFTVSGAPTPYDCDGSGFTRGYVGSTSLVPGDPAATATQIAQEIAPTLYNSAGEPQVRFTDPRPVQRGGLDGSLVEANITSPQDDCLATRGALAVLVLDAVDEGNVLQVLLVNVDLDGGPDDPPNRTRRELMQILDTMRQAE